MAKTSSLVYERNNGLAGANNEQNTYKIQFKTIELNFQECVCVLYMCIVYILYINFMYIYGTQVYVKHVVASIQYSAYGASFIRQKIVMTYKCRLNRSATFSEEKCCTLKESRIWKKWKLSKTIARRHNLLMLKDDDEAATRARSIAAA